MAHRDPSSPASMPTVIRYGTAVLSVAIAIGLGFFGLRHFEAILTPFLFAIAATIWYAGTGPGVLAIVLSVLSLNYFFLRPAFSFNQISYADLVYLTFCILCALAVGWVSAVRRRAEQELHQARKELEAKVAERTANLQRSESYLAETQKLTHTGSWAWDARSQKVLYCSEEMFRIYGLDPRVDLPTRKNFRQRVHPEDRNRTDERFIRVVNEKVDSFDEYRVVLPDGTVKHVNSSGHPVLDGNGELIAFIGTATDVTVRKRADEALRESEAKIRRLVDSNIIGIFIWDFDGRVLEANDEFLRMVNYDREDLVSGRIRWTDLTPPDWRERDNAKIEQQKVSGRLEPFEKEYTRKDGRRVPVLIGVATFEEGGNEGVAFVLDLTERKRAEEALRESEYKLRQIIETVPSLLWSLSPDGEPTHFNQRFLDYFGKPFEDFKHGGWLALIHPDDVPETVRTFSHAIQTGTSYRGVLRFRRADGEYRWHQGRGEPLRDRQGNVIQWYGLSIDIDEAKKAEQALRERGTQLAEARRELRQMIDTIPIPVASYSADARRDFVNVAWKHYTGLSDEAARGTEWSVVAHPEDTAGGNKMWRHALATGEPWHTEERVRRADGQYRWFAIDRVAARDENGKIIKWYGTAYDIEERKRAEEALRESEYKLRQIIDTIPAHVVRYRPDGVADFMNKTFGEFVGPGVGFDNLSSVVHPEDYPERSRDWDTHVAAAEPYDIEMRLRRADGVYRWHRSRRVPLRDANGAIVNWYGAGHDIDDQKRAEQALRRSEAYLSEAQRLSHTGSAAYNETEILYWSDEAFRIFGFDLLQGIPSREAVWQRIHPDDVDRMNENIARGVREKRSFANTFSFILPDGTVKHIESIDHPVFSAGGELLEIVSTPVDVTERKRAEEAYREAQLELAHANRVVTMGELTASIAHEVNQPITAVVTYASAARRFLSAEPPNIHEVDEALSLIIKEGNRAGEVVGRIRALIKKAPPRKDAVEINDAILEVIALTRGEAADNSVSVRTQLAEDLPRVKGDRVQLQQVLINLIINGIEAMRNVAEEERELLISSRNEPDGVSVEVRDSGPGFAPAAPERVFEAFYTTKPGGLGLGLSICRSIIEAHGGQLWASPNVPRGAIFGFIAPARPAAAS
jgi:PAS domain S-box-containing protein